MKKISACLLLLLLSILLTSCWDRSEIEEIGFVLGVSFDPPAGGDAANGLEVTHQVAIPGVEETAQEEPPGEDSFINLTATEMTNFKVLRNLNTKTSRRLNFEHLKVLIINRKLLEEGYMEEILDFFIRDHEMRRRTILLISKEKASDILQSRPLPEKIPSQYIDFISENHPFVLPMVKRMEVGEVLERVVGRRSYLLPCIFKSEDGELILQGGGIMHGMKNQFIDYLLDEDIEGYNWITGGAEKGIVEVKGDRTKGERFVFEIDDASSEITYKRKNGRDHFHVKLTAEGHAAELWGHDIDLSDPETVRHMSARVEEKIKKQAENIVNKMQHEYHIDIFEMITEIKRSNYSYWQTVRDTWDTPDGGFSKATITIDANVEIRHQMLIETLEKD
ncbi:Ger(x)C family spore germination protein [Thalassobacillus sp. C254]|uniref:Ger(x)C family spore germination protein n=1 Tax=Thalassobacillus sp. C254 TaxID=1225341 RepID=UPI0006CFC324|nr:Ger(x)C family spore germination protein [Thalassobacillus sp. C254]